MRNAETGTGYSTRRVIVTGVTIVALCLTVPLLTQRLAGKGARFKARPPATGHVRGAQEVDQFYDFVTALPSYQALEVDLGKLTIAGDKLLQAAAEENADALPTVASNYHASLVQVREDFAAIAERVGQERASSAFEELCQMMSNEHSWVASDFIHEAANQQED